MARYKVPRGTKDILPADIRRWRFLERTVRTVMDRFGYEEIRTPVFETTELFTRSIGTDTDIVKKEMYTFEDLKGRSLTLRPEGTAPVARAFIESNMAREKPLAKLFYIGPMFRRERPQKGRYRQFHQFGTEAIGSPESYVDAESIEIFYEILRSLGLDGLSVRLGSVGDGNCRPGYVDSLREYLREHESVMTDDQRERAERNPLRILDSNDENLAPVIAGAPSILDALCDDCAAHLAKVKHYLNQVSIPFTQESSVVRGLDYYTRTVFEIHHDQLGAQSALGGGGRYDRLVSDLGGRETPGVGFAAGMERIITVAEELGIPWEERAGVRLFVAPVDSEAEPGIFPILSTLRKRWFADGNYQTKNLKTVLKHANRARADLLLLVEGSAGGECAVSVKNMKSGEQTTVSLENIIDELEPLAEQALAEAGREEN